MPRHGCEEESGKHGTVPELVCKYKWGGEVGHSHGRLIGEVRRTGFRLWWFLDSVVKTRDGRRDQSRETSFGPLVASQRGVMLGPGTPRQQERFKADLGGRKCDAVMVTWWGG